MSCNCNSSTPIEKLRVHLMGLTIIKSNPHGTTPSLPIKFPRFSCLESFSSEGRPVHGVRFHRSSPWGWLPSGRIFMGAWSRSTTRKDSDLSIQSWNCRTILLTITEVGRTVCVSFLSVIASVYSLYWYRWWGSATNSDYQSGVWLWVRRRRSCCKERPENHSKEEKGIRFQEWVHLGRW